MNHVHHIIDAAGKRPGRVATEAAHFLRGKDTPHFVPHILSENTVQITNAAQIALDERKRKGKTYVRYSGYPGGLKKKTLEKVVEKKGSREVLRRAIFGMLPKNKLRARMMKHLTIEG